MAVLDGVEAESIVVKFFGIFFFFFQCNSIVGHIISTGGTRRETVSYICQRCLRTWVAGPCLKYGVARHLSLWLYSVLTRGTALIRGGQELPSFLI
jgi:hypothetical protein